MSTTETLTSLAEFAEPKRDRWGRPLITPPDGGKPTYYTRISTMAKALDDQNGLMKWMQRQVIVGLCKRDDLYGLARSTESDNTRQLGDIAEQAMQAAESKAAANTGTALHSFAEKVDAGLPIEDMPVEYQKDLSAYKAAMGPLEVVLSERFVVCDELEVAGSFDRLVRFPDGELVIADIKTGQSAPKYANSTAAQMAMYARSKLYDAATGTRSNFPRPVSTETGLLIHLPAGSGTCSIHKVDLRFGWALAEVGREVREWRKRKDVAQLLWENHA